MISGNYVEPNRSHRKKKKPSYPPPQNYGPPAPLPHPTQPGIPMPYQPYTPPLAGYNPYQGYPQQPYYPPPAPHPGQAPYPQYGYPPQGAQLPPAYYPHGAAQDDPAAAAAYGSVTTPTETSGTSNERYQKIVAIEMNNLEMAQKFVDISKQVQEITSLFAACTHLNIVKPDETALRDLEKRSKACSEQWMRSLESLDDIQLDNTQTLSKAKRKSVVNCAHFYMDQADALIQQIKKLQPKL